MISEPYLTPMATNGITLQVARSGPEDGPLVILLHGFPEPWSSWNRQIEALAQAGFRVLAPDQRGYGKSDKPPQVAVYALDLLTTDVVGIIEAEGRQTATLVGHDWGGIVAWWVAVRHPERVERLAVLNAPHPIAFRNLLRHSPAQLLKSWYVFFFQLPWLPEVHFRRRNWRALVQTLRSTSRPGAFSDDLLDRYRTAWSEPGAITAMLNWYRCSLRQPPPAPFDPRVHVPVFVIWGERDAFIGRGAAEASLGLCDDGQVAWIEGTTHWVVHEEGERVTRLLLEFLRGSGR